MMTPILSDVSVTISSSDLARSSPESSSRASSTSSVAVSSTPAGEPHQSSHDRAQFEADKHSVYAHPLFPLLALLLEKCELATHTAVTKSDCGGGGDALSADIQAFLRHQQQKEPRRHLLTSRPEVDELMIRAVQVLRIHLLELEKVQELCKDFCSRYITCLKGKMQSENLLRSDYYDSPTASPATATTTTAAATTAVLAADTGAAACRGLTPRASTTVSGTSDTGSLEQHHQQQLHHHQLCHVTSAQLATQYSLLQQQQQQQQQQVGGVVSPCLTNGGAAVGSYELPDTASHNVASSLDPHTLQLYTSRMSECSPLSSQSARALCSDYSKRLQ